MIVASRVKIKNGTYKKEVMDLTMEYKIDVESPVFSRYAPCPK
jgi:hypothetical protein